MFIFYTVYSKTELCVSFQVTASHQGKFNRCGMSWKVKEAIPADAERRLPLWSWVLALGPDRESQHVRFVQSSPFSEGHPVGRAPPPPPPHPRAFVTDIFNLSMEVKEVPTDSREACFHFLFLLRAPAISFHLIHSVGLLALSAVVMATGTSNALRGSCTLWPTAHWSQLISNSLACPSAAWHHHRIKSPQDFQTRVKSLAPLLDPNE